MKTRWKGDKKEVTLETEEIMCLAVPMEIIELLPQNKALVRQGNVRLEADVSLLEDPKVGDFTIVHAGFALEKVEGDEAETQIGRWDTLQDEGRPVDGFSDGPAGTERREKE